VEKSVLPVFFFCKQKEVNDVRKTEKLTAEQLVPLSCAFEVEVAFEKLKSTK